MKPALIDTDILSFFFRGDAKVAERFGVYVTENGHINISIITYYEVLSGLRYRDARRQLATFVDFVRENAVLPLTEASVEHSAEIYATTRAQGMPIDDIDILIAGIALEHDWTLVTHNRQHFEAIPGLIVEDWTE